MLPSNSLERWLSSQAPNVRARLLGYWPLVARPNQIAPAGAWDWWALRTGRGWGKTRTAAEYVRERTLEHGIRRVSLIGQTALAVQAEMIEGDTGLLNVFPRGSLDYQSSRARVLGPDGLLIRLFSAEKPGRLRGSSAQLIWGDELAHFGRPAVQILHQADFTLRVPVPGDKPRGVWTTTPLPNQVMRELDAMPGVAWTTGSSYENRENLAGDYWRRIASRFEDTSIGRQELYGEILEEVDGALWTRELIEDHRVQDASVPKTLDRVVVAVDPSGSKDGDEVGIVVVARARNGHLYVLADLSGHLTPEQWAARVVAAYGEWHADRVVAETNFGGDMVRATLQAVAGGRDLPFRKLNASRGKTPRAEPVMARYEQGQIHHVGSHARLEAQQCTWTTDADWSPDRMDALVWGCTELRERRQFAMRAH